MAQDKPKGRAKPGDRLLRKSQQPTTTPTRGQQQTSSIRSQQPVTDQATPSSPPKPARKK